MYSVVYLYGVYVDHDFYLLFLNEDIGGLKNLVRLKYLFYTLHVGCLPRNLYHFAKD